MKKRCISIMVTTIMVVLSYMNCGCDSKEVLDTNYIEDFHQTYFSDNKRSLIVGNMRLYVDYSKCISQAPSDGSTFYPDMVSILRRAKEYYSIKGQDIRLDSSIVNGTDIYRELVSMPSKEIPYAALVKAAEDIVNGDSEAILITDGELFEPNEAGSHKDDPYLHPSLKKWLNLGREIFIYSEPYKEAYKGKLYDKKRFYFVFTDTDIKGNIYDVIINQIPNIEKRTDVLQYHLTASHTLLGTEGQTNSSIPNEILSAEIVEACGYYEVQNWSALGWKNIKKHIIDAVDDETGEELQNGDTLIWGLRLDRNSKGSCFRIDDIYLEVSNVTELYQQFCNAIDVGQKPAQIKLEYPKDESSISSMNDFMILDKDEFVKTGKIRIFFDKSNFDPTNLQTHSNNLLKIDIKVKQFTNAFRNNHDARSRFEFDVLGQKDQVNKSVVQSIDAVLAEQSIRDMMQDRVLYTIYVFSNPNNL